MPPTTATTHCIPQDINAQLCVGLEVHVELATRSKMFTNAPNLAHHHHYDAEPNTLCDPVVLGMPGVLPVINQDAVEKSILVGLALDCQINRFTKWDRKSYFYPDLPKNYQISQYDKPLCFGGSIDIPVHDETDTPSDTTKKIRIIRAHLEEDAGKLLHEAPGGRKIDHSIVDLNRAGTPLLEIVTHPDFTSADQALAFCEMLRNICRFLGVSECVMQRGHIRFEPNINVIIERAGQTHKTPIVEIKNLNSFKALHGAIEYEHVRQVEQWLETGQVMSSGSKSTRGWDDEHGVTTLQREKEDAHDYRYFPDPDLLPVTISDEWLETIQKQMPQLPHDRLRKYVRDYHLPNKQANAMIAEREVCYFFEEVVSEGADPKRSAAMLLNSGAKRANEQNCLISDIGIHPKQIKQIMELLDEDKIGSNAADELFGLCCNSKSNAEQLAQQHGLLQVSDHGALNDYINQVLENPKMTKAVEDIRNGKNQAIGALIGQVMKLSKGQANPKLVTEIIKNKLQS